MSGIVGLCSGDRQPINPSLLQQMTDGMANQGPDAQTVWQQETVGLGHALLRTTAEQAAERQPLTLDQQVWIAADARLDDRDGLRRKLQAETPLTASVPDVELVLRAYLKWDTACVDHLMGDFSFLIWDQRQQQLFAARDHFGIVPFFYAQVPGGLLCSNTLTCVRQHPQVSHRLNDSAIGDYLLWGMNMDYGTTLYADIQRLPPAHTLTYTNGRLTIQRYWQLPRFVPLTFHKQPQTYVEEFLALFEQAIADRTRSDRIATHLSGGMDSTSIAAATYQLLQRRGQPEALRAFTMRDRATMPEEDSHAAMIAHYIGLPLEDVNVEGYYRQVPPDQPAMPWPEPNGSISSRQLTTDVTQRCADHARVLLTGFGGDPLLRFGEFYWIDYWRHSQPRQGLAVTLHYLRTHRRKSLYLRRGRAYWRKITQLPLTIPSWVNPTFAQQQDLPTRAQHHAAQTGDLIARYGMGHTAFWSNICEQLHPGYTGIPIQQVLPFFDLRLVQYVMSLPPIPWLVDKHILRQAMKGRLPEATRSRKKMVFSAPPDYSQTLKKMVPVWIEDRVKNTPGLDAYVDSAALLGALQGEGEVAQAALVGLEKALALAYWLRTL